MPVSAQAKTLSLIRDLVSADAVSAQQVAERLTGQPNRLAELAKQLAGAQRTPSPQARQKGLILFAADAAGSKSGSERVAAFFAQPSTLGQFAHQQQVKLAVTDLGLQEDFSQADFTARIFKQRQPLKASNTTERFWETVQAGVRMACLLRGKGTDVFGVGSLLEFSQPAAEMEAIIAVEQWEIAAMAGVIIGAASVQTLTVIGGPSGHAALALAQTWSPLINDYVISAAATNDFLGVSPNDNQNHLLGVVMTLGLCSPATHGTESR